MLFAKSRTESRNGCVRGRGGGRGRALYKQVLRKQHDDRYKTLNHFALTTTIQCHFFRRFNDLCRLCVSRFKGQINQKIDIFIFQSNIGAIYESSTK